MRTLAGNTVAYRTRGGAAGSTRSALFSDPRSHIYAGHDEPVDIVIKVETHNHPTAIALFPVGDRRGGRSATKGPRPCAKPKAGLVGFSVSHLRCPVTSSPGSTPSVRRAHRSALKSCSRDRLVPQPSTMNSAVPESAVISAPLSSSGRDPPGRARGYHKPIMLAGGLGNIRRLHVEKGEVSVGAKLVVLAPRDADRTGGGAASSLGSGQQRGARLRLSAAR